MANLTYTKAYYVNEVKAAEAIPAVDTVLNPDGSVAVEGSPAVEAVAAVEGGWMLANHVLKDGDNSWSGSMWLGGLAEEATDAEIRTAVFAKYGMIG